MDIWDAWYPNLYLFSAPQRPGRWKCEGARMIDLLKADQRCPTCGTDNPPGRTDAVLRETSALPESALPLRPPRASVARLGVGRVLRAASAVELPEVSGCEK